MNAGQAARAASGSAATLYSQLLPSWVRTRAKDFFVWSVDWEGATPLAAATTAPRTFQVDADASALLVAVNGTVTDAGLFTLPVGATPIKLEIRDTGSGRYFQNVAVMWDNLVGTAQLPGFLPFPKFVPRSSSVNVSAQNLDAANAWDVHLSFLGFKVFTFSEEEDPAFQRMQAGG